MPVVQAKLRIGAPNDKYEQEADSMADEVVQRLAQNENGSEQPLSTARPGLQRKPIFESEAALARQAVVLPEVVVQGSVCTGVEELASEAEGGSILDEAFKNAERLLAVERSYPFRVAFQRATTILDSVRQRTGGFPSSISRSS